MSTSRGVLPIAVLCAVTLLANTRFLSAQAARKPAVPTPAASTAAAAKALFLANLEQQVILDRSGYSVGEIDGLAGTNSSRATAAYLKATGSLPGPIAIPSLMPYTITGADVAGPFVVRMPTEMAAKAKLPGMFFATVIEALGERFHTSPAVLKKLNPTSRFIAGDVLQVPNVLVAEVASPSGPLAEGAATGPVTITVSSSASTLTVTDTDGKIIFYAPVTSGSEHDPLPIGEWAVNFVLRNPKFKYNPDLFWDAKPDAVKITLPPGPNGPVGVVWIDLTKPNYGIHGTSEPGTIGHSESHGCVRLTNWDVARLATLVKKGTRVVFIP